MAYAADSKGIIDYSQKPLIGKLDDDISVFSEIFTDDVTFVHRSFYCLSSPEVKCVVLYLDGMINTKTINDNIIEPVVQGNLMVSERLWDDIMSGTIRANDVKEKSDIGELVKALLYGDAIILLEGYAKGMIANAKGFATRSISEPDDEKSIRGPREGFTEALMLNSSLIRRKIQTSDLKFKPKSFGARTSTRAFLCYLDSLVDKRILADLEKRLEMVQIDGVLDANYIQEFIKDSPRSLFEMVGNTEKPDIAAAKILEGRIAIMLDGTPIVLTVPNLFVENLQAADDYYTNFYYGSIGRILRMSGFLLTISAPALYVALIAFHPEMIPTSLMLSLARSINQSPFPTVLECIGMLIVFEVLRETGIRTPDKIGQALSVVGALIVGQAAVEARIVSAPVVIVVAFTGITGLMVPRMSGAVIALRFALIVISALLGFYGYLLGMVALLLYLGSLKSFGIDYTSQMYSADWSEMRDIYVRSPLTLMKDRPLFMSSDQKR